MALVLSVAKAIAYIDGFNFYYGAVKGTPYKWLNLRSLLEGMFPAFRVTEIKYFTARVAGRWFDLQAPIRQEIYWRALRTLPNLSIIEGTFLTKPKSMAIARARQYPLRAALIKLLCPDMKCSENGVLLVRVLKTEEKGSDVNLAAHLINDAHLNRFDEAIVVSGDSDLCEAVKIVTAQIGKPVTVANPQRRVSRELGGVATHYRHVHESELKRNLFPPSLTDTHGTFTKPLSW